MHNQGQHGIGGQRRTHRATVHGDLEGPRSLQPIEVPAVDREDHVVDDVVLDDVGDVLDLAEDRVAAGPRLRRRMAVDDEAEDAVAPEPVAVFWAPPVLLKSALRPVAGFSWPLLLFKSA